MKRVVFCLGVVWQSELKEPVTLSSISMTTKHKTARVTAARPVWYI